MHYEVNFMLMNSAQNYDSLCLRGNFIASNTLREIHNANAKIFTW